MANIKLLCDQIRQISYAIHRYHGHGHLEKVYENALVNRLRKAGLDARQQHPITVYDEDGTVLGSYLADVLVENALIVEVKARRPWLASTRRRFWDTLNRQESSMDCSSISGHTSSK